MNVLERLCAAINYPDPVRPGTEKCVLIVDEAKVTATVDGGRLILSRVLANGEDFGEGDLGRLAGYAAGRTLKEEATIAWDPDEKILILWQAVSADSETAKIRLFFEVFCTSCDWWASRIAEGSSIGGKIPEMVFLP